MALNWQWPFMSGQKKDGGHRGYLDNYIKDYPLRAFPGSWKPPLYSQALVRKPLHPYWGKNRTFSKENASLVLPEMISYDTTVQSEYYQQFKQVYDISFQLTQLKKEIAIWWSDDPDVTVTPAGHLFSITSALVKDRGLNLISSAQTYASVGMSVADAFINCWKWKYHFFSERPSTFIPQHIDSTWHSFWPDPPFPAFPSGHAIQASAAAHALRMLHGNVFRFVDSVHVGRPMDQLRNVEFKPRKFERIWDVAVETANSRFFGGIHTPQDNQVGLDQGIIIAENIHNLRWKKIE